MKISFLLLFVVTVRLSSPMLVLAFRNHSGPGFAWLGTVSACVIYSFLFGLPAGLLGFAAMLVASMVASAIGLSTLLKRPSQAQALSDEAQALKQALLHKYFPNRPRPFELAQRLDSAKIQLLRADPRFRQAEDLYLQAIHADLAADYSADKRQQELNLSTAYSELCMLHRHREQLDEAVEYARKAISRLEPLAREYPQDKEVLTALSIAYFRCAEANHVAGAVGAAKACYERGLRIDEQLGDIEGQQMYRRLLGRLG
jgi:tetratricopeptide (TPR) repeat protein